jgi:polyferredoxin
VLIGVVLGGAAFCGWVCPFGTLQDGLTWLRTRLGLSELKVPARIDRWLLYGRFVTLGLILYMTISTVTLWFAGFDPYRTIFSLGWLFELDIQSQWPAYLVAVVVLVLSFFIPRFWCKYTCPLGGVLSLVGHLSLLRIRRNPSSCKGCAVCEIPCPVGIAVASANPVINTNCIGCLACVEVCPRRGALEVQLAPSWFTGLRALIKRARRPSAV